MLMYDYDNDQLQENYPEKFIAARKQVSVFVLLQVQGAVWCKPCEHFSMYDVQRIRRCFAASQEDNI